MSRFFFISDLHLSDKTPEILSRLQSFLTTLDADDQLFILGDFYDAWVGDDDDSQFSRQTQQLLAETTARGIKISVMHGNRDFMIGDAFSSANQVNLLPDPFVLKIASQDILLTHGDQLCSDDTTYLQARQMRLAPEWLAAARAKPLAERRQIAIAYRQMSGEAKSNLAADIMDVNAVTVVEWFKQHNVSLMIHGHTHRPARHHYSVDGRDCERIVLDQWHADRGMALCIDEHLTISEKLI